MIKIELKATARHSARVMELANRKHTLLTPTYFPAVSGTCESFKPEELIGLIASFSYPRILISSYDLAKMGRSERNLSMQKIYSMMEKGAYVFLDSGMFEAFWKQDSKWSFDEYKSLKQSLESDIYTTFDALPQPRQNDREFGNLTIELIDKSMLLVDAEDVCAPIVHGKNPKQLISTLRKVMNRVKKRPSMVAVAERDCGASLSERARTVAIIRETIDKHNPETLLHILGCGNPVALALYAYHGADSFDSLDWTEHVIQKKDYRVRNLFHLELIQCECRACSMKFVNPMTKPLLHNLLFYQEFVSDLREMIRRDTLFDFLLMHAGKDFMDRLDSRRNKK